jgi:ribosome-associated protein
MTETIKKARKKPASASTLVRYAVKGIEEKKGSEIVCINLKKIPNNACDYFLICEGNSRTQVQAIAGSVEEFVKKNTGDRPWHIEGMENGEWILMDYVDVVVHIFQPEARSHYNLENMWADADVRRLDEVIKEVKVAKAVKKKKKPVKKKKAAAAPKRKKTKIKKKKMKR